MQEKSSNTFQEKIGDEIRKNVKNRNEKRIMQLLCCMCCCRMGYEPNISMDQSVRLSYMGFRLTGARTGDPGESQ